MDSYYDSFWRRLGPRRGTTDSLFDVRACRRGDRRLRADRAGAGARFLERSARRALIDVLGAIRRAGPATGGEAQVSLRRDGRLAGRRRRRAIRDGCGRVDVLVNSHHYKPGDSPRLGPSFLSRSGTPSST
jgi:hypothetical protein